MQLWRNQTVILALVVLLLAELLRAQPATRQTTQPASAPASAPSPVQLLLLTQSKGHIHEVAKRMDNRACRIEQTFAEMAGRCGLFNVEPTQDASIITPEKLKDTRVVVFYTTGDLPMAPAALDQWIKEGGLFLGIHCATDTFHGNATYLNMIGGEFIGHPWNADTIVTLKVNDANHPASKTFPDHYTFKEEIYQHQGFDPKAVRVLISLDMQRTAMKRPMHIPVAWCREYGKGKIFYTSLGHREDVWTSQVYQDHLIGAIKWLIGLEKGDATPNPRTSAEEEKIAKEAAGPASADSLPKVPDGWVIKPFIRAPEIHSPSSIAVTPDGKLFVGEDEYNSGLGIEPGLSRVKLCVDTDNDDRSDRVTVFADHLNAPQGMTFVGDTLFIVHAPFLSAFRDTNGDGVADVREDLVTGLGPKPEGLVHHIPSGIRMGIDGWLYIAIGDKGIKEATGKDGRKITLHGGGVVRVRPEGSELEVFASGTRNIYAVAIDPFMNIFTRDNTNDGGGWNSRLSQIQRDGVYGYPSLFKNFGDEIIPCIEDYGGGGATGSLYLHEPNFPGTTGDCLYTLDWGKSLVYRHDLRGKGATFAATQEEFIKPRFPTSIDSDGQGRLFLAEWARRSWGKSEPEGVVYLVHPQQSVAASFPKLANFNSRKVLDQLLSPSGVRRREAQWQILRRGSSAELLAGLSEIAQGRYPLYSRVAAIYTLVQLDASVLRDIIVGLLAEPEMREHVLRAVADRDMYLTQVDPKVFITALADSSPRVRAVAAIALGHLEYRKHAGALLPLTADTDVMVRHAAQQALRRLDAADTCIAALHPTIKAEVMAGALRTLRGMHEAKVVSRVAEFLASERSAELRQEAVKTLARLYQKEADWDGSWWLTRPDTRGPNYKAASWEQSGAVAELMMKLIGDTDPPTAKQAITYAGICAMSEAAPALAKLAQTDGPLRADAARAVIEIKATTPESLASLEQIILCEPLDGEIRSSAAQALGAIDIPTARAATIRAIGKLDSAPKVADSLLDKCADVLCARAATAEDLTSLEPLLKGAHRSVRVAAAAALLRSEVPAARDRVAVIWKLPDCDPLEALLAGIARVPADASKGCAEQVRGLLKDKRNNIRHAAIEAAGHLTDTSAIDDLVALAGKDADRIPAAEALAQLGPEKIPDAKLLVITRMLVQSCTALVRGPDRDAYGKLLAAAEKFVGDSRIPKPEADTMLLQLKQAGVVHSYQRTDPIPAPDLAQSFTAVFAPEQNPGGPFTSFVVGAQTYDWKPLLVSDPHGLAKLEMPTPSIVYLTATYESATAGKALLTLGSDDGVKVWLNGKQVHTNDVDRGLKADVDKVPLALTTGTNLLLFRVNNKGDGAGIQSRLRTRVPEFDLEELPTVLEKLPGTIDRGKALFDTLGCIKCHTLDGKEEPKGPYLGDAGAKFDMKHLIESIVRPGAKIAQGFATEKIIVKADGGGQSDYLGFITRESADEVQLRDTAGKVSVIPKSRLVRRVTLSGSIMPDGLADSLPLDDFSSLVMFLQSKK